MMKLLKQGLIINLYESLYQKKMRKVPASANPFDKACTLVKLIENRVTEIANNECPDYPNIKGQDIFGELWAIEQTIAGVLLANKDLHAIIEKLNSRCDRDDKLIFKMKDEISKYKATINNLRQKLKARKGKKNE